MAIARKRQPRQADVARLAGVSQATVSAVINGRGRESGIPEQTARRVREAVQQLGYVANQAARSLKGKGNRLIGIHSFESMFPLDQLDFYHEFLVGIEQQAVADGYDLVLFASAEDPDGRRPIYRDGVNRLALADGSVLLGVDHGSADLARLAGDGYPFVHIGRRKIAGAEIAWIGADYQAATSEIVARLAGLGHRRIGYVTATDRLEVHADKEAGYRAGCAQEQLPELMYVVDPAQIDAAWIDAALSSGLTALLAENEELARRIALLLIDRGAVIPADMSIVVLVSMTGADAGEWSALSIPRNEMGRTAVKQLINILTDDAGQELPHVLLPCGLPGNATIAPPRIQP